MIASDQGEIAKFEALPREDRQPSWTHGKISGVAGTVFFFSLDVCRMAGGNQVEL